MKKFIFTLGTTALLSSSFAIGASAHETYQVQKGDTLWKIAQNHNVSIDQLKENNQLSNDLIFPNQEITISTIKEVTHTVKPGDTLWAIASQHGVTVPEIMSWNNMASDAIYPGDELNIQVNGATSKQEAAQPVAQQPIEQSTPKAEQKSPEAEQPAQASEPVQNEDQGMVVKNELTVTATAYTANCEGCSGTTATGIDLKANPNEKVIAVDPNVIPLGSKVYVDGYGYATAADTGGAIKGNKIDVFIPSKQEAIEWGNRQVNVKIIE
ncbi:3D domain-containing protein [Metabacillus iocasae]|uniref:3D (Asp-Asp-Asp) domain-containing protein/LysM repeat protein n=1 Tax=Priestia iocasae TaxID=2291674 RepID=A0ABS2QXW2_9BACI|nr:3D domain-containing protein [Metabacillus iocasae]MBM7703822.1 3D (Asp-Asp-Asp) domain-containing protein/LysM repeat protein [Metabacillus iocasae]